MRFADNDVLILAAGCKGLSMHVGTGLLVAPATSVTPCTLRPFDHDATLSQRKQCHAVDIH